MLAKLAFAAGALVMATAFAPLASAAPAMPQSPIADTAAAAGSLVEKTHFRRCRAWRHECAARWGWGGRRFHRCLARHGC
jgi:hypothetical protein